MPCDAPQSPTLTERIERALVLLAYFMEQDGDVHLAMYEKFEEELAELISKRIYGLGLDGGCRPTAKRPLRQRTTFQRDPNS